MLIHQEPNLLISFGGKLHQFAPQQFYGCTELELMEQPQFQQLVATSGLRRLMALKQVHGIAGAICEIETELQPYAVEGDYLITSSVGVGLGVASADCLPIVLFDKEKRVVAAIHAGWRGSVAGIVEKALQDMQREYGTQVQNIKVFFGPHARVCCYEVAEDFIEQLCPEDVSTVIKRSGHYYFDLLAFHRMRLMRLGILPNSIQMQYAVCTMCREAFCSKRREQENSGRQMTIVCLM